MIYSATKGVHFGPLEQAKADYQQTNKAIVLPVFVVALLVFWILLIGVSIRMTQSPLTFPSSFFPFSRHASSDVGTTTGNADSTVGWGQVTSGTNAGQTGLALQCSSGMTAINYMSGMPMTAFASPESANQLAITNGGRGADLMGGTVVSPTTSDMPSAPVIVGSNSTATPPTDSTPVSTAPGSVTAGPITPTAPAVKPVDPTSGQPVVPAVGGMGAGGGQIQPVDPALSPAPTVPAPSASSQPVSAQSPATNTVVGQTSNPTLNQSTPATPSAPLPLPMK